MNVEDFRLSGSGLFHSLMTNGKKEFWIYIDPTIKRTTCIWMSCGSSNGWKKAIDIFRDFL